MSIEVTRKLAAILAADAAGYSRLMGQDEEDTVRVLAAHRSVIDGIIAFHHGRIVGTAGDSVLAEFASAVEALRCAVEIQQALKTRNESLPPERRMHFRIGINLGDVVVKGADILGDGVNVAARLESIAEPGGICISSSVYDQIAGKLDLGFVEMGEQNLKNIGRPIRAYRVATGTAAGRAARARAPLAKRRLAVALATLLVAGAAAYAWRTYLALPPAQPAAAPAPAVQPLGAREPDAASQRMLAEQRRAAEHEEAQAAIAAANAHAQLEIAKARAEAELARAKAEAEALKREAAAELVAVRRAATTASPASSSNMVAAPASATPPVPGQPAPATEKVATTVPVAIAAPLASPERSSAPKPVAAAASTWSAILRCDAYNGAEAMVDDVRVRQVQGRFQLERRPAGAPGHLVAEGVPASDGSLRLTGTVIAPRGRKRGEELPVALEGKLEAGRYATRGYLGSRPCSLDIAQSP